MDISNTIVANSDQLNAADLTGNPITVTIREVTKGDADQPVFIHLREIEGKTWRPSKSMRRVLVKLWGADASQYAGKRVTLYNDPTVKWAGQPVGGIRISNASGLDKPVAIPLQVARGKIERLTVEPLKDQAPQPATITQQTWDEINTLATDKGVENVPAWISEQLGRKLQGWSEITEAEGDQLLETLTTGEVQS